MVRALRDYLDETGHKIGFKPAGGMKSAKDALNWQFLMMEEMGREWLEPDLFRWAPHPCWPTSSASSSISSPDATRRRRATRSAEEAGMNAITKILETMDYGLAPEDSGIVDKWLEQHKAGFGHFIGGSSPNPARHSRSSIRRPARRSPGSPRAPRPMSTRR
jgi:hypothetical protein